MKIRKTYTLLTLLTGITIIAVLLALSHYFSASQRYKRNGDGKTLNYLLSTKVSPGDSIERVIGLIGPGHRRPDVVAQFLEWQDSPRYSPAVFPQGVKKGDVFIEYTEKPGPILLMLQFRDGKIVNFDPKEFAGPDPEYAIEAAAMD